jgi:hypothetical protein
VRDFYIGKYLVTQMQWTATMGTNPAREPTCGMTCPVENVSWNGLTCTLPSICTTKPPTGLLPDSGFVTPANAPSQRAQLVGEYQAAFQYVEQGQYAKAIDQLQTLEQNVSSWILDPNQTLLSILVNNQIGKLAAL